MVERKETSHYEAMRNDHRNSLRDRENKRLAVVVAAFASYVFYRTSTNIPISYSPTKKVNRPSSFPALFYQRLLRKCASFNILVDSVDFEIYDSIFAGCSSTSALLRYSASTVNSTPTLPFRKNATNMEVLKIEKISPRCSYQQVCLRCPRLPICPLPLFSLKSPIHLP